MNRFRPAPAIVLALVALAVLNTLLLFGHQPLNPTNTLWIFGDNATYYSGWEQYRHDPHLHFPLPWTERAGYPVGTSIALLDAIPLVAVALRPLSPWLPDPFQYLGLWAALCFVLQAYFGFSLLRRLIPEQPFFCAIGALLLVLSLPLTDRGAGHTALMSQWLILAALDAYFRDPGDRPVAWLARVWIVLALAAGITPYLAAMCFILAVAAVARLKIERRCGWTKTAALFVATVAVVIASGAVFGVLVTDEATAYWAPGYGQFSWNLNGFVNPIMHGSILLPRLRLAFPQQYEGYSYLGLGIIALVVLNVARRPSSLLRLGERRVLPLVVAAIVCAALAASTTVTFGARTLFVVSLPKVAVQALGGLRASGRLVWPAYYLIYVGAIALSARAWRAPYSTAILAIALVVQFADAMPLRRQVRAALDHRFPNPTTDRAWQDLGRRYGNLILLPALQCDTGDTPGAMYSFVFFGKLAAEQEMRLNSYYAARYPHRELKAHCVDLLRQQLDGPLDARSAYVVSDGVKMIWQLHGVTSHTCEVANSFNLCTPRESGVASATPDLPAARPYRVGDTLDFTTRNGTARPYLKFGWEDTTFAGTWTTGPLAMLRLGFSATRDREMPLLLHVDASPFLAERHPETDVDVVVNGITIAQWTYRLGEPAAPTEATIPPAAMRGRNDLTIEFRMRNPESPAFAGMGPSAHFLGLAVTNLTVRRASDR